MTLCVTSKTSFACMTIAGPRRDPADCTTNEFAIVVTIFGNAPWFSRIRSTNTAPSLIIMALYATFIH